MVKENVKLYDGTEKEIEIVRLSPRKAYALVDTHFKLDTLKANGSMSDGFEIKGNLNGLISIKIPVLENSPELKAILDDLDTTEIDRLYTKFYEQQIYAVLGSGGNPN